RDTVGPVLTQLRSDEADLHRANRALAHRPGLLERRRLMRQIPGLESAAEASRGRYEAAVERDRRGIDRRIEALSSELSEIRAGTLANRLWLEAHPEAGRRLHRLVAELAEVRRGIENRRRVLEGLEPLQEQGRVAAIDAEANRRRRQRDLPRESPTPRRGMGLRM
ncbi:MAG TPA: hypothetical protein VFH70_01525, partial [Acidimicrobiales bacterium]|nr:hypothetical protein [Acidimicrobiales bacterium]